MKDWPRPLRLSAAAGTLAQALYYSRCEAYGIPAQAWDELPTHVRNGLFEVAHRTLVSIQPEVAPQPSGDNLFALATELARKNAARIVGRITPSEPWGVEPDPHD